MFETDLVRVLRDAFPISHGHALITPKRHFGLWREATDSEKLQFTKLIDTVQLSIEREAQPEGFNVGFNDGPAAQQTIPHFHLHVVPRLIGDVEDPRGGLRNIIPHKAKYWEIEQ